MNFLTEEKDYKNSKTKLKVKHECGNVFEVIVPSFYFFK